MRAQNSRALGAAIRQMADGVADYLVRYLVAREDFGMRSFYGETFALALLAKASRLDPDIQAKLLRAYERKDRSDPEFHWEFNNYAMLEAGALRQPLTFKHTPCTNWTLLRANVRIRAADDARRSEHDAVGKLRKMQQRSGLILDDPGVRSFQYHCFSAAMVFEIYQQTGNPFFLDAFNRAVAFIRRFILPNGDALYIGRGQQQSFGYASLIYILSAAFSLRADAEILGDLQQVLGHLSGHVRADGSLPLVLGGGAEPLPHPDAPHRDARYPGWYAYNNYFDYLPFAGLFLHKAAALMLAAPAVDAVRGPQKPYRDADFIKAVVGQTIAVVSRPGGYWTNDLPVPYVYSGERVRTACYGGEQFGASLYSPKGIPWPINRAGLSMRWRAMSFLMGDTVVLAGPAGLLLRRYIFSEQRVEMHTRALSPFRLRDRYLFGGHTPVIHSQYPLVPAGTEYSASGPLQAFEAERVGNVVLEFP